MPTPPRPLRPLLVLALVSGVVLAGGPTAHGGLATDPDPAPVATGEVATVVGRGSAATWPVGSLDPTPARDVRLRARADRPAARTVAWIDRVTPDVPEPAAKSMSRAEATAAKAAATYRGRNHVWIPALGIDRPVTGFACSSSAYPGDRVYRWGCAGSNNVYLFGHAHSVFKPLHDAYVRGRLAKGMQVVYADGGGRVSTYAVRWWKVTTPDDGAWAYAAQSTPSLTLQTCVGAQSQYRLIVRLTKVG